MNSISDMPSDLSQSPPTDRSQGDGLLNTAFSAEAWKTSLEKAIDALIEACIQCYGERLGSVGRGTSNPQSDIDLLIVAERLPKGRMQRVQEFGCIEQALQPLLRETELFIMPRPEELIRRKSTSWMPTGKTLPG
jgi:predicted nucleotidyltransferase